MWAIAQRSSVACVNVAARRALTTATASGASRSQTHYAWGVESEDHDEVLRAPSFELSYDDVLRARKDLTDHLAPSPLDQSARLSKLTGIDLYMKKENTLRGGSYKIRGAICKLVSLSDDEKKRGAFACNFVLACACICRECCRIYCVVVWRVGCDR